MMRQIYFLILTVAMTACIHMVPTPSIAAGLPIPGLVAGADSGETSKEEPKAVTIDTLEELVRTIEDEAERKRLLENIHALIAARSKTSLLENIDAEELDMSKRLISILTENVKISSHHMSEALELLSSAPVAMSWVQNQLEDETSRDQWMDLLAKLAFILGAGWVAGRLSAFALSSPRQSLESREAGNLFIKAPLLLGRTVLDLVPIAVFAVVAYGLIPVTKPGPHIQILALTFINGYLVISGTIIIARLMFVPTAASLRLFAMADVTANYLFIWVRRISVTGFGGFYIAEALLHLGIPTGGYIALMRVVGILALGMIALIILQNRKPVAEWLALRGTLVRRFAAVWHVIAIIYAIGLFTVWALGIQGGFEYILRASVISSVIIGVAYLINQAVRRLVQKGFALKPELKALYPTLETRTNRYLPVFRLGLRVVIYLFVGLAILQTWGINVALFVESSSGQSVIRSGFSVVVIVLMALIFWEVISSVIERYLNAGNAVGGSIRSARTRTLLPLLQKTIFVVLCVIVLMIVLSEIGLDIAPLLAGAGVVGLAVGFGAQQLVKDVITGIFILIEDTISVGDYVDLGGTSGTVEAMSIRSIRLRDAAANVHTIPFSSVDKITNMTRDYSYAVILAGIGYSEDADYVIEVLHQIGAELQEDQEFNELILEPLYVQGVDQLADSAVVIKSRIKTLPGYQWSVRREFQRLMKRKFDELGIEIPFPHTTVYFGAEKPDVSAADRMKNLRPQEKTKAVEKAQPAQRDIVADDASGGAEP